MKGSENTIIGVFSRERARKRWLALEQINILTRHLLQTATKPDESTSAQ